MKRSVKSVTSPKKFIVGHHLLNELSTYTTTYGDHAYVICDEFILDRAAKEAGQSFEEAGQQSEFVKFNLQITQEEIDRHCEAVKKSGANVIVGIGGGKTLDTAKATAYYVHLPVVIFPTIASTDAPAPHFLSSTKQTARLTAICSCQPIRMWSWQIQIF